MFPDNDKYPPGADLPSVESHCFKVWPSCGFWLTFTQATENSSVFWLLINPERFQFKNLSEPIRPKMIFLQISLHCKVFRMQLCKSVLVRERFFRLSDSKRYLFWLANYKSVPSNLPIRADGQNPLIHTTATYHPRPKHCHPSSAS